MNGRLVVLAAASLTLAGCGAVGATDVAASVDDAELTVDELAQRAGDLGIVADGRISGDDARVTIANWIGLQAAERSGLVDRYLAGPVDSGITCVFAVPAPDATTGDDWLRRLRGGEAWASIAEESIGGESIGEESSPGSAVATRVECLGTAGLVDVADQLAELSVDDPYALVTFPDQTLALVKMQTVGELNGFELLTVAQTVEPGLVDAAVAELDDAEVTVAPRYGVFDPDIYNVVPLGSASSVTP